MASTERLPPPPAGARDMAPAFSSSRRPAGTRPPIEYLFETIVEASFDLIEELGNISLNVYLHAPHDDQPLLFIRQPRLASLDPSQTFRLMHTVTMLSNGRKPTAAFRHGSLDGHYVRTTGPRSDGLYVFGGLQDSESARRITSVALAFSHVLHQFHLDDDETDARAADTQVSIASVDGSVTADARLSVDGSSVHGRASAFRADESVVRAVIDALAPNYVFDEVRTLDVGQRSAVLAVLRDQNHRLRLGLAIAAGDLIHTTALATRRAIES